jgi:HK97 family phage portal protein
LLEGGLDWKAMGMTPKDMDFVEAKHSASRDIALAFGVPPMLLGIPGDNTYANYQEANRALWRLTILPLLAKLTAGVAAHFSAWWPDLTLDIDRDAVPALSADRERLWAQVSAADFLTAVDKRRLLGLEVSENVTEQ